MTHKFDKNKPHGEIWGGMMNARFVQNGIYFDHEGNPVAQLVDRSDESAPQPAQAPAPQAIASGAGEQDAGPVIDADMLLAARRGVLMPRALVVLEGKAEDIIPELPDYDEDMLAVMAEVEGLVKKRKSVAEAIAAAIQAKQDEALRNAAAVQGQPIAPAKATFGTMAGENQLSAQLST